MKLSVVIPFRDEERNVLPVVSEIRRHHPEAEIVAVDDHSQDRTFELLSALEGVQAHRLREHLGQSAALHHGLCRASGDVCVILDGDGQSSVADIKRLLEHIPAYDLVVGRRLRRNDPVAKRAASWIANGVRRRLLGDGVFDTGGTPKAMTRECARHLIPFDGMHRFIPALLSRAGYRVLEVEVTHRRRLHGDSHYSNAARALRGLWDLVGVDWLSRRLIDPRLLADERPKDGEEHAGPGEARRVEEPPTGR